MNPWLQELEQLYSDALEKIKLAAADRRFGEGILGIGRKMSDEPCHMELLNGVKKRMEEMGQAATSQEAREAIRYVCERPECYQSVEASIYWTMLCAHGQTVAAIPRLNAQDAVELYNWYQKAYPKRTRLPIQNNVVKALKNQI